MIIYRTNEQRAEYHLTRRAKVSGKPPRVVEFWDGTAVRIGEFWAYAKGGLWLTADGEYVFVAKSRKNSTAATVGAAWQSWGWEK